MKQVWKVISSKFVKIMAVLTSLFSIYLLGDRSIISLIMLLIAMLIYGVTLWNSKVTKNSFLRFLNRFDYEILVIFTILILVICYDFMVHPHRRLFLLLPFRRLRMFFPLLGFITLFLLLSITIIRLRDKTFIENFLWGQFYQKYDTTTKIGVAIHLSHLSMVIAFILFVAYKFKGITFGIGFNLYFLIIMSVLFLIAFTYIEYFILQLGEKYDQKNLEKIKSERFKADLITNVSHDIRTPLTSIINYIDLMKGLQIQDAQYKGYLEVMDRKSQRLKTLISDLLDASKAGSGNLKVDFISLNFEELIGQVAGEYDQTFIDNNLDYIFETNIKNTQIKADGNLLYRVLENVYGNASKYSLPHSRIYAKLFNEYENVIFTLKNISALPLNITTDELLEQFTRGDKSRSTEGNGLGLYISKEFVENMGGNFEIGINGDLFEVIIKFPSQPHNGLDNNKNLLKEK
ncbi:sensor histidine kinase [Clostridium botulinum]|uniref:histidine kinase n=1 Tax=Clostridium botulinum TaxID=1491 RepID=A0ABD7CMY3_CLOBO|nr:HAMP domain-containing sensor histidine kinase [Clostridium botulinum]KGO14764.1 histidine kinase [Clostridium botulinum]KIN81498.1 histidine kinase [Clostridium botulinum]MCC5427943.1 HAMP domain-containing histidine kinase [Clostridium botulinum]QRI54568.1 HAMP domain-containing histidine kinase [Clostridium botulinum]